MVRGTALGVVTVMTLSQVSCFELKTGGDGGGEKHQRLFGDRPDRAGMEGLSSAHLEGNDREKVRPSATPRQVRTSVVREDRAPGRRTTDAILQRILAIPPRGSMDDTIPVGLTADQLRLAAIREHISTRLWPVTAGMSSHDFNKLMDQMAMFEFTFERRGMVVAVETERRRAVQDRRASYEHYFPGSRLEPNEPKG